MAESYIRAGMSLEKSQIQSLREQAKEALKDAIMNKGKHPEDYTITDILPAEDLGFPNEKWEYTFSNADEWETLVDQKLPDEKFIVFYGYTNTASDPATLAVRFYKGASIEQILHTQGIYAQKEPFAYFEPIVWAEGDQMKVELYGKAAATDEPVFLGFVATRKGARLTK